MSTWLKTLTIILLTATCAWAQTTPPLRVQEADGSPSKPVTKIIVDNGTLVISGTTATIPTTNCSATVATLPTAASSTNHICLVTDGNTSSTCTVGGGSNKNLCYSNGSAWVQLVGGTGADNLGNHTLTQDLEVSTNSLDGDSSLGLALDPDNDGTNEAKFSITGALGIGTTAPSANVHIVNASDTDVGLRVVGAASQTGNYVEVNSSGGSNGNVLTLTSAGNLGVGTTAPDEKLHVNGNAKVVGTVTSTGTGDSYLELTGQSATVATPAAGKARVWVDSDTETLNLTDDDGDVTIFGASAGGGTSLTGSSQINLSNSYASVTTTTITADSVVLVDSSNAGKVYTSVSETCTITTSGAGGLEASDSEASSTWYEVYLEGKSDGTIDCLLNAAGSAISTNPAGYSYSRQIGYVYNNASSNFEEFYQAGDWVDIDCINVLSNGTQTSYTDVSLATCMPPKSRKAMLSIYVPTPSKNCRVRRNGSAFAQQLESYTTGGEITNDGIVGTDSSQVVEYKTQASGSCYISVIGYGLNI